MSLVVENAQGTCYEGTLSFALRRHQWNINPSFTITLEACGAPISGRPLEDGRPTNLLDYFRFGPSDSLALWDRGRAQSSEFEDPSISPAQGAPFQKLLLKGSVTTVKIGQTAGDLWRVYINGQGLFGGFLESTMSRSQNAPYESLGGFLGDMEKQFGPLFDCEALLKDRMVEAVVLAAESPYEALKNIVSKNGWDLSASAAGKIVLQQKAAEPVFVAALGAHSPIRSVSLHRRWGGGALSLEGADSQKVLYTDTAAGPLYSLSAQQVFRRASEDEETFNRHLQNILAQKKAADRISRDFLTVCLGGWYAPHGVLYDIGQYVSVSLAELGLEAAPHRICGLHFVLEPAAEPLVYLILQKDSAIEPS